MQAQTSGLLSAMDCFSEGIMLVNTATESWDVLFVNDAWSRITSAQRPPRLPARSCPAAPTALLAGPSVADVWRCALQPSRGRTRWGNR